MTDYAHGAQCAEAGVSAASKCDNIGMKVLGIESSCDETAAAVYDTERGLLAHALFSQIELHAAYGGVVPELASRDHVRRIVPLIRETLQQAQLDFQDLDGVAYTAGPGLAGALMVGASVATGIALAHDLAPIPVHHMEAHLLAPMLEAEAPDFPFLALLVSGGHTLLVAVRGIGQYEVLGESLDDAVGEAFDKTAKLMGLPYPGGPYLAQLAEQGRSGRFKLPRPMLDKPNLDFSFSGLKTAVLTALPADADEQTRADLAHEFQEAVVETLSVKCRRALDQTGFERLVVAGGVGANRRLRAKLAELEGIGLYFPRIEYCTDNAAMVAYAGAQRVGERAEQPLVVRARWPLSELQAPVAA